MTPSTVPAAALQDLPDADLIDRLGLLRLRLGAAETEEKAIKNELTRRGIAEAEGNAFKLSVAAATRWTLDSAAVKREMGEAWWQQRCRMATVITFRITPRIEAIVEAAAA